ncbi:MAG: DNA mismatch repair endonuclease MutL [Chloroflexi bacterium]|nr:DNA mismatch repair endonuclease MutL [Chloroflexota bacterium]
MSIRLLADDVVSQIAAGEVVERPASVVKELVENALDAGARTIVVEADGGGRKRLRVSDDGCGIPASEVELALARHATSKLTSADDLFRVGSLGFRGEALASIASVSHLALVTRASDEANGTQIKSEGGKTGKPSAIGAPHGTIVGVENLFFNVPARLKFLKSEISERRQIDSLVTRYAMAYPHVRFRLLHDGRQTFQSSGMGNVREALIDVFGVETAKAMIEIGDEKSEVGGQTRASGLLPPTSHLHVIGFVSPPDLNRSNRREITIFVNGRWVQDARLSAAVMQAYHTLLMVGRYPIAVVMLTVPPDEVDVNVHPAKAEVRFRNGEAAFSAVERAVRRALVERAPIPSIEPRHWASGSGLWRSQELEVSGERLGVIARADGMASQVSGAESVPPVTPAAPQIPSPTPATAQYLPASDMPLLRVVGQIGAAYVVAEGPDGLYLIDQHAAHERVLYEAFSLQRASADVVSQALLEPLAVELPPDAASLLEGQLGTLNGLGFSVEHFGGNTFLVRALPTVLGKMDPARAVRAIVEDFEEDETPLAAHVEEKLIARVCKRAAVKAGQVLSPAEQVELVRRLEKCASPRTCPHGRPTMIHLSVEVLERQFGRK